MQFLLNTSFGNLNANLMLVHRKEGKDVFLAVVTGEANVNKILYRTRIELIRIDDNRWEKMSSSLTMNRQDDPYKDPSLNAREKFTTGVLEAMTKQTPATAYATATEETRLKDISKLQAELEEIAKLKTEKEEQLAKLEKQAPK